jgi:hypothetical protein
MVQVRSMSIGMLGGSVHEGVCIAAGVATVGGCCKGNLADLRRIPHLSLAKGNPKRML